jgi:hypothetical protein
MKLIKTITLFVLFAGITLACNNQSSKSDKNQMKSDNPVIAEVSAMSLTDPISITESTGKSAIEQITNATKAGKAVFLVVTGTGVTETDKTIAIANAAKVIYKNAVIVEMDRDDPSNEQLVSEYRLAGAPLPLILVISSKGFPTGGYLLAQATPENVAALVPSPKLEDVYQAIFDGKYAIVVFSKKSFTDKPEVVKTCKKAISMLNNEAVLVEVDMDDSKEVNFLNQLRIDKSQISASLTLVINKQGQISGTATNLPDAAKLVAAAKTPVKGGCGPGCGPAGCGK